MKGLSAHVREQVKIGPIGPNSREVMDRGGLVSLTSSEADAIEVAVLDWVRERLAGAREGAVGALVAAWSLNTAEREGWNDPSAHARGMTDAGLAAVAEALGVGEVRG